MRKAFSFCLMAMASFFVSGCNQADPLAEEIKQQIVNPPLKEGAKRLYGLCFFTYVRDAVDGDAEVEKRKTEAIAYAGLIEPIGDSSGRYKLTEYGKEFAKTELDEQSANVIFCTGDRNVDVSVKEKINDNDVIVETKISYENVADWVDNKRVLEAYPRIKKIREVGTIIDESEYRKKDNGEWYMYRPIKSNMD